MKKLLLRKPTYLSRKAGAFAGVPQRTVQSWTEKGLLPAEKETGGTGDRRLYSPLNVIEIGIIKSLTNERLPLNKIRNIFSWLRFRQSLERVIDEDHVFLVHHIDTRSPVKRGTEIIAYSGGEGDDPKYWLRCTSFENSGKVLILNIGWVIKDVLAKIEA